MNYQKIYDDICKRGQERELPEGTYSEKHHIVPKCMQGTNEKSNITKLTAREHFLVHLILSWKLYPENRKLSHALHSMIWLKSELRYIPSGRIFEEINKEKSNLAKLWRKEMPMIGSDNHMFGKTHTLEFKKLLSDIQKNSWTKERKEKHIIMLKTRIRKTGFKQNEDPVVRENRIKKLRKPVIQYDMNKNIVKEWISLAECKRNGFSASSISQVCKGIKSSYKKFLWEFKKDIIND